MPNGTPKAAARNTANVSWYMLNIAGAQKPLRAMKAKKLDPRMARRRPLTSQPTVNRSTTAATHGTVRKASRRGSRANRSRWFRNQMVLW